MRFRFQWPTAMGLLWRATLGPLDLLCQWLHRARTTGTPKPKIERPRDYESPAATPLAEHTLRMPHMSELPAGLGRSLLQNLARNCPFGWHPLPPLFFSPSSLSSHRQPKEFLNHPITSYTTQAQMSSQGHFHTYSHSVGLQMDNRTPLKFQFQIYNRLFSGGYMYCLGHTYTKYVKFKFTCAFYIFIF